MSLPIPRFINLIWYRLSDGYDQENKNKLRANLEDIGSRAIHPLHGLRVRPPQRVQKTVEKRILNQKRIPKQTNNPIMGDPISSEVDEIVQRESPTNKKVSYIPPWYLGEKQAFEKAKQARTGVAALPKMKK